MHKTFVQPSYGCCGTPVVARMCVYTAGKIFNIYIKFYYKKKYWNKNEKHFNEQKVGMLLQKEQIQEE